MKSMFALVVFQRHDGCTVDGKHEGFEAPRYSLKIARSFLNCRPQRRDVYSLRQRVDVLHENLP